MVSNDRATTIAHGFTVPGAQSGQLGALASPLGRAGQLDETVAIEHAALCDPR